MGVSFGRGPGVSGKHVDQEIKCRLFSQANFRTREKSDELLNILRTSDRNFRCEKYGFGDEPGTLPLSKASNESFYSDFVQKACGGFRVERKKSPMIEMHFWGGALPQEVLKEKGCNSFDFNRLNMSISPSFFSDQRNISSFVEFLTTLHLWSQSRYTSGYHHDDYCMRNATPDIVTLEGYPDDRDNYYTQSRNLYNAAKRYAKEGKRCPYVKGGNKNIPDNLTTPQEFLDWMLTHTIMKVQVKERCVDSNITYYLSGLFWLQIFGKPYIDMFGREKLLKCPAYQVKELPDGSIMLQMAPSPLDYAKPEVRARAKQCEDFLGSDCFFQHDDGWGAYKRGSRRVPVFDFSGLVMDQATMEELSKISPPPSEDPSGGMNVISRDTAAAIYLRSKDEKSIAEGIERYFRPMRFGIHRGSDTATTTNDAKDDLPLGQRRERDVATVPLEGEWTMLVEDGTGYDVDVNLAEYLSGNLKTTAVALVISENTGGVFYWKYLNGKLTEEVMNTDEEFTCKLPREKTKDIDKDELKETLSGDYLLKNLIASAGIACFGVAYRDVVGDSSAITGIDKSKPVKTARFVKTQG